MAVFDEFGDRTDSDLLAELIGKVILIVRRYPSEKGTTPIFLTMGKFCILKSLVTKLTVIYLLN